MRSALFLARSAGSNRGLATVSTCSCSQRASWRAGENRNREFESGSLRQVAYGQTLSLPVVGGAKAQELRRFSRMAVHLELAREAPKSLSHARLSP